METNPATPVTDALSPYAKRRLLETQVQVAQTDYQNPDNDAALSRRALSQAEDRLIEHTRDQLVVAPTQDQNG